MDSSQATTATPALDDGARNRGEWTAGLESLDACPVCSSSSRTLALEGLRDVVFDVAPGSWRLQRCAGCECFYLDPRPTRQSIMLAYGTYFTHTTDDHNSLATPTTLIRKLRNDYIAWRMGYELPRVAPLGRWLFRFLPVRRRRFERLVRDFPAPTRPSWLLDVGCGSGEFLARMRELGWNVVGQELDDKAAEVARARGLEVVLGSLEPAAFGRTFDAITLHQVIEHVHDPVDLLRACHALLSPGGRLWIATPNVQALGRRRFGAHWRGLEVPRHLVIFSRGALELALRRAGFAKVDVRPDVGMHGSMATSVALHHREAHRAPIGPMRIRLENLVADAVMQVVPGIGEELVATAER